MKTLPFHQTTIQPWPHPTQLYSKSTGLIFLGLNPRPFSGDSWWFAPGSWGHKVLQSTLNRHPGQDSLDSTFQWKWGSILFIFSQKILAWCSIVRQEGFCSNHCTKACCVRVGDNTSWLLEQVTQPPWRYYWRLCCWRELNEIWAAETGWPKQIANRQPPPKAYPQWFHGEDKFQIWSSWVFLDLYAHSGSYQLGICQVWILRFLRAKSSNLGAAKYWTSLHKAGDIWESFDEGCIFMKCSKLTMCWTCVICFSIFRKVYMVSWDGAKVWVLFIILEKCSQ